MQIDFSQFEGKAVLVVNVASQCGFTDNHYKGLKRMLDILSFNNKLVILGGLEESFAFIYVENSIVSISLQPVWWSGAGHQR